MKLKRSEKPKETRAEKRARKASDKAAKKARKASDKAAKRAPAKGVVQDIGDVGAVSRIDAEDGSHTSAHELTHVMQQRESLVAGSGQPSVNMGDDSEIRDSGASGLKNDIHVGASGGAATGMQSDIDESHFKWAEPTTVGKTNVIMQEGAAESAVGGPDIGGGDFATSYVSVEPGGDIDIELEPDWEHDAEDWVVHDNRSLWKHARILVPVDVQALVINEETDGSQWAELKSIPTLVCCEEGCGNSWVDSGETQCLNCQSNNIERVRVPPSAFDTKDSINPGRPKGIHLHWAMPDALMHGEPKDEDEEIGYMDLSDIICLKCGKRWPDSEGTQCPVCPAITMPANGSKSTVTAKEAAEQDIEIPNESEDERARSLHDMFDFPQLPDRWLVVRTWPRLLGHKFSGPGTPDPYWDEWNTKAWVVESDTLQVTPYRLWNRLSPHDPPSIPSDEMTAVGPDNGDLTWTVTYDNAEGRFTFHDEPEDDVKGPLNYFVSGWYSDMTQDPLWCSERTLQSKWWQKMEDYAWSADSTFMNAVEAHVDVVMKCNGISWNAYTQILPWHGKDFEDMVSNTEHTLSNFDDDFDAAETVTVADIPSSIDVHGAAGVTGTTGPTGPTGPTRDRETRVDKESKADKETGGDKRNAAEAEEYRRSRTSDDRSRREGD